MEIDIMIKVTGSRQVIPAKLDTENHKALQEIVDGTFQLITFPIDPSILLAINEEGKLRRLPPSMVLATKDKLIDILVGNIAFVGRGLGGELCSLTADQQKTIRNYARKYAY